ncbi:MAG TPA: hypothetical protein DCM08_07530 [Microscillaceae bacterium]|jgi:hypothetical protein|nr:hypothetical protein [Microscillaceae bacterium]
MGNSTNRLLIGLIMTIAGGYLFLNSVYVFNFFNTYQTLMTVGRFNLTTGYVLIPFIFGIGLIFYDSSNFLGWLLAVGGLGLLFFGIITNLQFTLRTMSAFELILITTLLVGGIGLTLSGFRKN